MNCTRITPYKLGNIVCCFGCMGVIVKESYQIPLDKRVHFGLNELLPDRADLLVYQAGCLRLNHYHISCSITYDALSKSVTNKNIFD
jgi:hypothetical protein